MARKVIFVAFPRFSPQIIGEMWQHSLDGLTDCHCPLTYNLMT